MYFRKLKGSFLRAVNTFPVVVVTGARQTGKSTLCKTLLSQSHVYVSLEDPDTRRLALEDPRTFLKQFPPPVIIDEIQYAPDLPSYIQGIVDADRRNAGQFVLTGSQNFLLMEQVSQSLAGRAALLELYPCSVTEIDGDTATPRSEPAQVADWILRGAYPEPRSRPEIDRRTWCGSYIRLYLERDVRRLLNVGDLDSFERFLRLTALRTGQILNISDLARDAAISPTTAKRWLSLLQSSYQVHLLQPFATNLSKRLIKSPKLYFGDTGLASYLMGIHDAEVLLNGAALGPLFETAVFLEHVKWASFRGDKAAMTFFRTKDGTETDFMIEENLKIYAREAKSSRTLTPATAVSLLKTESLLGKKMVKTILAPIEKPQILAKDVTAKPWHDVAW